MVAWEEKCGDGNGDAFSRFRTALSSLIYSFISAPSFLVVDCAISFSYLTSLVLLPMNVFQHNLTYILETNVSLARCQHSMILQRLKAEIKVQTRDQPRGCNQAE